MTHRDGQKLAGVARHFGSNSLSITPAGENGLQFVFVNTTRSGTEAAVTVTLQNLDYFTSRKRSRAFSNLFINHVIYDSPYRNTGDDVATLLEIPTSEFTDSGVYVYQKDAVQPFGDFLDALKSITIQGSIIKKGVPVAVTRDGKAAPLVADFGFSFGGGSSCGVFHVTLNDNIVWQLFVDEYTRAPIDYIYSAKTPAAVADLAAMTAAQKRIKHRRDGLAFSAQTLFGNVIDGIDSPAVKEKARFKRLLENTVAAWQAVDSGVEVTLKFADSKKLTAWLWKTRIYIRFISEEWITSNRELTARQQLPKTGRKRGRPRRNQRKK